MNVFVYDSSDTMDVSVGQFFVNALSRFCGLVISWTHHLKKFSIMVAYACFIQYLIVTK